MPMLRAAYQSKRLTKTWCRELDVWRRCTSQLPRSRTLCVILSLRDYWKKWAQIGGQSLHRRKLEIKRKHVARKKPKSDGIVLGAMIASTTQSLVISRRLSARTGNSLRTTSNRLIG